MADLILKVSSEEVRTKAQQIQSQKNLMNALMEDMKGKVSTLQDYWQSQSGQNYAAKYDNVSKNINNSLETLMTHINNLTDAAQRYEEVENTQVQRSESLSTGNIF